MEIKIRLMNSDYKKWYDIVGSELRSGSSFQPLYDVLIMMKDNGIEQDDVYSLLMNFLLENRDSLSESQEDILLEIMDVASGYCSHPKRIWDSYITR
jgi:hypothetical protein